MKRMDLTEAGFLLLEKRETPMHVGGVNLFTLPDGADEAEFLAFVDASLRETTELRPPFDSYAVTRKTGLFWEKDAHIDMDYHVRHSALPAPGRYRELFALASRLHTTLLDRTRPLWELHLIEGLQGRQFAAYNKVHHAAIDGIGGMHLTQAMCTEDPGDPNSFAPFSMDAYKAYKRQRFGGLKKKARPPAPTKRDLRTVIEALKHQYDSGMHLATAMRRFGMAFVGRSGNLAVPWHNVPRTSINTRVSGARRFVAQSFAFERIRAVGKAMDGTVNDVVLALCAGALRRYLISRDELPLHSLKAMAPVSLREEADIESTNAIGFITADLATNVYDPEKRLRTIQESMRAGKDLLRELSPAEAALFMQLTQVPALVTSILGLGSKFPAFSTVVSNVPGPRKTLYWHGARLDGIYPASIVFDGFAMNITLVSYTDKIDVGIIACRRSLPQIQRIIDHIEDSLQELEEVAGLSAASPGRGKRGPRKPSSQRAPVPKRTPTQRKAKTGTKQTRSEAGTAAQTETKPKTKAKVKSKAKAQAKTLARGGAATGGRKTPPKPKPKARARKTTPKRPVSA